MRTAPHPIGTIPITQARRAAFRALQAQRWTDPEIAAAISVHIRTLRKWRAEERKRAAEARENCLAVADYLDRA